MTRYYMKKCNRKKPRTYNSRVPKHLFQQRTWIYDDEVMEQSRPSQICLYCYNTYTFYFNKRFYIKDRFCETCRNVIPSKHWRIIASFFKVLEKAMNRHRQTLNVSTDDQLQFLVSIYKCVKFKHSRDLLIEMIKPHVNISYLATPIELGELLEQYDVVFDKKNKHKCKKRLYKKW